MAKAIRCRDIGVECDFEARAETEEELMGKMQEHARKGHGMTDIPEEMVKKLKEAVRDE
ncbi:MAG: hypothetical protein BMS9Abin23_0977 [Thermodesulfobacteriota bacterium]|nr:MAG: hypothetical protein BMS9Abin23_0977 [Thermodesulfobacteriota bacterium]